jgi:hypothetical protein
MEFAEFKPVAYLESETPSLVLEKLAETRAYRRILGALADTALGEGESRALIATVATEFYADREGHDDRAGAGRHRLAHEQRQRYQRCLCQGRLALQ